MSVKEHFRFKENGTEIGCLKSYMCTLRYYIQIISRKMNEEFDHKEGVRTNMMLRS